MYFFQKFASEIFLKINIYVFFLKINDKFEVKKARVRVSDSVASVLFVTDPIEKQLASNVVYFCRKTESSPTSLGRP